MKPTARLPLALLLASAVAHADDTRVADLEARIDELEAKLDARTEALASELENSTSGDTQKVHIGGYGELHVNLLSNDDEDIREVDFHRFVLFFGYDFSDSIRLVSELEVEHVISSSSNRGAVELEQAYIEFDLADNMHVQGGLMLVPIGILNETHEPPTFYGVERPVVETTVIPTTWYVNAARFVHKLDNGLKYEFMISEGFKTEDPNTDVDAEPFNLKAGKQKGSFASLFDPAYTARVTYTGMPGLELAAYTQFQPDIDQSAEISYADSALFIGGHVIYQFGAFTAKALYGNWELDRDEAAAAGKDKQNGGYAELDWKVLDSTGVFVRQSAWSLTDGVDAQQTDLGVNYYPHEDVVIKANYQIQNDDAGAYDGLNIGIGYQF